MAHDWIDRPLGDVITLQRGFDLPIQDRKTGNVPIVSSSGITGTHSHVGVGAPGVVTGRYGTIGQVFYIEKDFWPLNTTLYVKDFKGNDPRFISYLLQTIDYLSCSDKSSVPGVNRNDLHQIMVAVPGISEQRAIAWILETLDAKIELNQGMNETLEATARTIFKSWFVDFDPVRAKAEGDKPHLPKDFAETFPDSFEQSEIGAIPQGWEVRTLYDCAHYVNGSAFRTEDFSQERLGLPVIKIGELKVGITDDTKFTLRNLKPKYRIQSGDILFSWSGSPDTSIDVFVWTGVDGWLNQHIFKVESRLPEEKLFVYFLLCFLKPVFVEIARNKQTTGLGHVTGQDLKRLKTVFPCAKALTTFNRMVEPLFQKVYRNRRESHTLAILRDALLPKLVAGEIRLKVFT